MSRGKKRGPERKPTDVRQREIVDAAMQILAQEGTRHFTSKNLATKVGITSGAIFRHFATMDDIADAVISRMEAILFEGFPPDDPDPLKCLESFFKDRIRVILNHQHIARMLLSDHLKQSAGSTRARRVEDFKVRSRGFVRECLESAREKGQITEPGLEERSVLVLGAIFAIAHASTRPQGEGGLEQLGNRVWSLLERMLRGGEHRPGST